MTLGRGFTLLELSIVLLITSVLLGATLTIMTNKTDSDNIKETERRMDVIEKAIAAYVATNNIQTIPHYNNQAIPCPDSSLSAVTTATFGIGVGNASWSGNCDSIGFNGSPGPAENDPLHEDMGGVPTKTLQIPDEYAFDAWGNRILYVMDERCHASINWNIEASASPAPPDMPGTPCSGLFTIVNTADVGSEIKTTEAIYVLISHGKNGYGAYSYSGTQIPNPGSDIDELQNNRLQSGACCTFAPNNGVYVQKAATTTFDDIVHYKTREQVIKESGTMIGPGHDGDPANIDPICKLLNTKLGLLPPASITNPNPPLMSSAIAMCGSSNNSACIGYTMTLASILYVFCNQNDVQPDTIGHSASVIPRICAPTDDPAAYDPTPCPSYNLWLNP